MLTEEVRERFQRQMRRLTSAARGALGDVVRQAEDELVRLRLAGGAMHSVFSGAILRLLKRQGPLATKETHRYIQALYPDLCDDSVDRVIDGRRFGKKWKHAVRTAQQHLKAGGYIDHIDGMWRTVSEPPG